jgi:hypothetical protein
VIDKIIDAIDELKSYTFKEPKAYEERMKALESKVSDL